MVLEETSQAKKFILKHKSFYPENQGSFTSINSLSTDEHQSHT